ncbi:hypothetical protein A2313_01190 [Candidatus Roizmanbacteria bacterium RIFOXYB2_FULL_41_10]|uniref:DUF4412 domain-containing protein n=1 Tax=Candidatus Roizmanbacteria bacterium RIFOXYA1_FULL_41_12 TaxID=1802082 RepID=A0A1F7KF17_9BACT|nr:MAG: hypothetical protein A2209_01695 [Candidatus Roizmanbacteria bacterium RIFOXYA1_FULL_41_12]OGK67356.1 MAG: hypothetical protein A2262_02470 [Candidatus Roizmanbacteria bacterium RIFOXYA2_FULL_41_8]OGK67795.1 MAG: hypothetical protein A2377_04100 [Candidatus Roizmanbacteria bacterium RIFOXYB1_FULL_41_27]OGK69421.1 MAG: hypothetical protein A2313_01190 [Candidatus Roizmanbacteria bacterium RIFOXYB2_FULL_41_10]OGK71950.1 MAG: hypothetical protein A2403_03275 [Candidatus Roizmanbacteria bac
MKKLLFSVLTLVTLFSFSFTSVSAKSISGTISDLLKKKQSLKCTYSYKMGKQTIKGVMYTSNQKYRSEFESVVNKLKIKTYTLSDGKNLYMWNSNSKQGTKMNIKQMQNLAKKNNADYQKNQNLQQLNQQYKNKYQFKCQNFKPQTGFFKTPNKITFTDLSAMLEGLKENICNVCNSLPSDAKQACLANCQ